MDWDQATAKVEKIMGKGAKVPDIPSTCEKAAAEMDKTWNEFDKFRDQISDKLLAYEDSITNFDNAVSQFSSKLGSSDLGADRKAADYKKKRADAQKVIDQFFAEMKKVTDGNLKNAKELDKHVHNLAGYKTPPKPNL